MLYTVTRINAGLSPDEKHVRELHARIRRDARGRHQIAILGTKGGAGRTAVTVSLGSVLAHLRGDRILAIDADPASGNLADRAGQQPRATIAELLANRSLKTYNDVRPYMNRTAVDLEVLAAQRYGAAQRGLRDDEWARAIGVTPRFYNLTLTDCGTDLFGPATTTVLSAANGIVIVTSASIDGVRQAAITMNWLNANGYRSLLARACVVVNHLIPGKPSMRALDTVRKLEAHVPAGRLFVLPWDDHVAAGTGIRLDRLGAPYTRTITELAAALSDDFGEARRTPAARAAGTSPVDGRRASEDGKLMAAPVPITDNR
ncbi:MinD/ParA family protein [Mycolicibacterium sp. S2-37]|uniref:MinD/ParA family ATP-binding protein n=1 Tax=Mycolicibacterium sp. S2-37 TaxID=2810297 RepID=UPI001F5EC0FC|nr:MinD/ParA family protein [Mycolicibacterium sp. S2-37]